MSAEILVLVARGMIAASAAILIVLALRTPVRRRFGAGTAYGLWLLAPVAAAASYIPSRVTVIDAQQLQSANPSVLTAATENVATTPLTQSAALPDAASMLLFVWLTGVAFSLLMLARRQSRTLSRLKLRRDGALYRATGELAGPAVIGVLLPRIVVPDDFESRYDEREQLLVLAHERAHIRAGDALVNAIAALAQCLNWFNPLFHIARTALRVDQELACDERVMRDHGGARRAYAEAMLKTQLAARSVPLGCQWPPLGAQALKERISMLARPAPDRSTRALGAATCAAFAGLTAFLAWAAQPPRTAYADEEREETSSASLFGPGAQLVEAMQERRYDTARELIAAGADVNHFTPGDGTPLVIAARDGRPDLVDLLLDAGADPNRGAHGDGSPLIAAAANGHMDIVAALVTAGADVNGYVRGDETPLINAARENRLDAARFLIARGADVNLEVEAPTLRGLERRSPMSVALERRHNEMIRLLREHGARD